MSLMDQYFFKFSNGLVKQFTESGAQRFAKDAQLRIIDCNSDGNFKNNKRIRDGFTPGWQPQLGMIVTCPGQYRRILKERGLIEVGNEKGLDQATLDVQRAKDERVSYFSEENLKAMAQANGGLDLSDGDVRKLRDKAATGYADDEIW